jgi:hypothetical protein
MINRTKIIGIRLNSIEHQILTDFCNEHHYKLSSVVRTAIEDYIKKISRMNKYKTSGVNNES